MNSLSMDLWGEITSYLNYLDVPSFKASCHSFAQFVSDDAELRQKEEQAYLYLKLCTKKVVDLFGGKIAFLQLPLVSFSIEEVQEINKNYTFFKNFDCILKKMEKRNISIAVSFCHHARVMAMVCLRLHNSSKDRSKINGIVLTNEMIIWSNYEEGFLFSSQMQQFVTEKLPQEWPRWQNYIARLLKREPCGNVQITEYLRRNPISAEGPKVMTRRHLLSPNTCKSVVCLAS